MANLNVNDNPDLLSSVSEQAEKKGISTAEVYRIVEEALEITNKLKYGKTHVVINKKTGKIEVVKRWLIIADEEEAQENIYPEESNIRSEVQPDTKFSIFKNDEPEEPQKGIKSYDGTLCFTDSLKLFPNSVVGQIFNEPFPDIDYTRLSARAVKQIIRQLMNQAERRKQYTDYKVREHEIVSGIIRKIDHGNITVELNNAEALLLARNCISGEVFREDSKIKAYIEKVEYSETGAQIILSRTHPGFLAELFKQEVPEVYDGIVEIKRVARDPGSKAKVAVYTADRNIEPIGTCVGIRGSRVQAISAELNNEKIDIIAYHPSIEIFVTKAIGLENFVNILKIIVDEENKLLTLWIPIEQVSLAIGKSGQNVQLASALVGWKITVVPVKADISLLMKALNINDVIARMLVAFGFRNVVDIANAQITDIFANREEYDSLAKELHNRALEHLEERKKQIKEELEPLNMQKVLCELPHLTEGHLLLLGKANIINLESLAWLSSDDLKDIIGIEAIDKEKLYDIALTKVQLDEIIITARGLMDDGWVDRE